MCVQEKYYDLLGHNLYDLCSRMLAWDPDQRITAQGALQSQYCRVRTSRCHTPEYEVGRKKCANRQVPTWVKEGFFGMSLLLCGS